MVRITGAAVHFIGALGNLNSDAHDCGASTLTTEPSTHTQFIYIMDIGFPLNTDISVSQHFIFYSFILVLFNVLVITLEICL